MNSTEIKERLRDIEKEKTRLEFELAKALENEAAKKAKDEFSKTKAAILKLWETYWKDDDNSEAEKRLNEVKEQYRLDMWLEAYLKEALKKSKLEDYDSLYELVKDLPEIRFKKCVRDAEIRLDFATALKNVRKGTELSAPLEWSFGPVDLMELMKLHKANKFRTKIEDLLTDCNFHSECGLLSAKEYDEFEKLVLSDD